MMFDTRETRRTFVVLIVLFLTGLLFLAFGFTLKQGQSNAAWSSGALTSLGISVWSVLGVEGFLLWSKRHLREQEERRFESFFGLSNRLQTGQIILQADRFERVVMEMLQDENGVATTSPIRRLNAPKHRAFKARRWINAHDTDGARVIRDAFRRIGYEPPEIELDGRDPQSRPDRSDSPFVISMGLGFSDVSDDFIRQAGNGWIKISQTTHFGDAISLLTQIWPGSGLKGFVLPRAEELFTDLIPKDWEIQAYVDQPDRGEAPPNPNGALPDPLDYAMILRHTQQVGERKQVRFVIAGFTAHGTREGARYLADNWRELQKLQQSNFDLTDGDFCVIIKGRSHESAWRRIDELPWLTPEYFVKAVPPIECEWSDRYRKRQSVK